MRKFIIILFILVLLSTFKYGFAAGRTCVTNYTEVFGVKYFSGIHCTEDIDLSGVSFDYVIFKKMSPLAINRFLINNADKVQEHIDGSGSCDTLSEIKEIKGFEETIYGNNNLTYSSASSSIETKEKEIEDLQENYNDPELYYTSYDTVKAKYPLSNGDFIVLEAKEEYYNKQAEIKKQIIDKQKEKLVLLYKIKESQKEIEKYYEQIKRICESYVNSKNNNIEDNDKVISEKNEETDEEIIKKYKDDFDKKLGDRISEMTRPVLESLSIKLLSYADESPIFKRFNDKQKELVKLKIKALKQLIDDEIGKK